MKKVLIIVSAMFLFGCTSQPTVSQAQLTKPEQCYRESDKERSVRLDLIRQLVDEGQYYSALAHLEREDFDSDGAQFLVAESLRKTGQLDPALREYQSLQKGCLKAYGHLGAGKILAVQGKLDNALVELKRARDYLPTDANIRNDFGFALLASGQFDEARQEFVTAIQLDKNHEVAIRNLILSLILNDNTRMAWSVADHHQMPAREFQNLLARAVQFHKNLQQQRVVNVLEESGTGIKQPILIRKGNSL